MDLLAVIADHTKADEAIGTLTLARLAYEQAQRGEPAMFTDRDVYGGY